jgi:hypothetical protein
MTDHPVIKGREVMGEADFNEAKWCDDFSGGSHIKS